MKCPKCGYLGFEHVERCRNCGYDFSLAPAGDDPELAIRDPHAHDENTPDDLALIDGAVALDDAQRKSPGMGVRTAAPPSSELPLFGEVAIDEDDEPLITRPSPPRPPLSVRRATPDVPRLRSDARTPMLDLSQDPEASPVVSPAARAHSAEWPVERPPRVEHEPAAISLRGMAATIDVVILGGIDIVVIYFALQICGLSAPEFYVLPKIPLAAFLALQNGGYLVAFTLGGQTLGKMAAGIKVIPARSEPPIDLGRAIIRAIVWAVLAAPAGLGLLTALVGREHRGLHDRLAGTRVIRMPA
jgi:uncharacterized RDD family membrane protein YckC